MVYNMSKYTKVDVLGDGACYFHAVTGFLEMEKLVKDKKTYYKGTYDTKEKALRKRVVNWLRNNLNFQYENGLTVKDDIEDEIRNNSKLNSIPDYLQDMSKNSSYAGQIEITATANLLKRSIRVYIMKNGTYSNVGLGYEISKSTSKDITLFHNLGSGKAKGSHHFEILFPKSKGEVVPKSQYNKSTKPKSKPKSKSKNKKKTRMNKKKTRRKNTEPTKNKRTNRRTRRP